MPTITLSSAKTFSAKEEETVLDAALRSGIVLEYSCKTGRCGTCKAKLTEGRTVPIAAETGLNQAESDEGWILTCVRSASSDLKLEVDELSSVSICTPRTLPCRVLSLELMGVDVMRVKLRLPPGEQFSYQAGQYIDVIGKGGIRRSYSVANAAASSKFIELHIRKVLGGAMSRYWFDEAKPDDLLRLNGPLGTFFLRDVSGLDLVLLATGTGIAPIKAMLEGLIATPSAALPRSISVYWGGRVPDDIYWDLSNISLKLDYHPVLSRPNCDWNGATGYVQDVYLSRKPDLPKAAIYACGSVAMIESAKKRLVSAGLNPRRFYSDAFVSSS